MPKEASLFGHTSGHWDAYLKLELVLEKNIYIFNVLLGSTGVQCTVWNFTGSFFFKGLLMHFSA